MSDRFSQPQVVHRDPDLYIQEHVIPHLNEICKALGDGIGVTLICRGKHVEGLTIYLSTDPDREAVIKIIEEVETE